MTVDADGGEPDVLLADPDVFFLVPAWSPDGEHLALIRTESSVDDATIWTIRADGTDEREVARLSGANWIDWHPDGESLLEHELRPTRRAPGRRHERRRRPPRP